MAINPKIRIPFADVFPFGAYVVSEVEPVRDYDKSTRERPVQQIDKETGQPMWSVSVLDADPAARKTDKTVTVKISADYQPVPPEAVAGMPFAAVEFDGLTVTPYVDDKRGRVAFSLRATAMRAPHVGGKNPSPRSAQSDAA